MQSKLFFLDNPKTHQSAPKISTNHSSSLKSTNPTFKHSANSFVRNHLFINRSFSQSNSHSKSESTKCLKRESTAYSKKRKIKMSQQKTKYDMLKTISENHRSSQIGVYKKTKLDIKKRTIRQKFRRGSYYKDNSPRNSGYRFSTLPVQKTKQFDKLQKLFIETYKASEYEKCSDILLKVVNYCIDVQQKNWFIHALINLSSYNLSICRYQYALFFYNQARQSSLLLNMHNQLIISLIGMAKACTKMKMYPISIQLLKKALQYSWYCVNQEEQLHIYDEIGKVYYLQGTLDKAKAYHERYACAQKERKQSPQRILSGKRIQKLESLNVFKRYDELCKLMLVHLDIPIFDTKELPQIYYDGIKINEGSGQAEDDFSEFSEKKPNLRYSCGHESLRDQIKISQKYKRSVGQFEIVINKIMKNWMFSYEMEEPDLNLKAETCSPKRTPKLDFNLKKKMKQYGLKLTRSQCPSKYVNYKETLQQKIEKKLGEPGLKPDWDNQMMKQIKRDRINKLFKVQNKIQVRDRDKPVKLETGQLKKLFVCFN